MILRIINIFLLLQGCILANDWINENIELTINGKFNQAINLLENRISSDSTDYKAYFYLAATYNSRMTHFENFEHEVGFFDAIDRTIRLVQNKQDETLNAPDSIKANLLFYLGSAYGYRGYYEGRKGNWYSALSDGMKAIDLLEEAVELDTTLYQAYLGIGTYDYWSSSKIEFALWLPFIADNREEGIKLIKKSLKENGPSRYMAMHQLVYILLDFGHFEEAQYYAGQIIQQYPESQFMWWAYSHVYYKMRKYEKAITSYNHLIDLTKNSEESNPAHIVKCNLKIAQLNYEMSEFQKCIHHCNLIFELVKKQGLSEKLEDELDEAREYLESSNKKILQQSSN